MVHQKMKDRYKKKFAAIVAVVLAVGALQVALTDETTRAAFMDIAKVAICSYLAVHLTDDK